MKVLLSGNFKRGVSTLEILIAFAVLVMSMSAVIMVVFSNQSLAIDTQTNVEALSRAGDLLEGERSLSRQNFLGVVATSSTEAVGPLTYAKSVAVADLTPCAKRATSTVSWLAGSRTLSVQLSTVLTDVAGALALGGDCATSGPSSGWTSPQRFASDTYNPGKPTALDALERMVYMGADKDPFFYIADTHGATLGQSGGLFVTFANGFKMSEQINDLDTVRSVDPATGASKYYVYAAMASSTKQLAVIDVTDKLNPTLAADRRLSTCVVGSFPEGWRVQYYAGRLYFIVRETAGPELHIFDVSTPTNPVEFGSGVCKGTELNATVEDMAVRDQVVAGITKRYAYFATDQNTKELRVYDVTAPAAPVEVAAANVDLSGNNDAASVYAVGTKIFLGRQSTSGPDAYVFNATNPDAGMPQLGAVDVGTGVIGIRVAGSLGFFATPKTNQEFQVWNVSNPASMTNIAVFNFGNVIEQGLDYEPDFIYATGQSTPNFQMLWSP